MTHFLQMLKSYAMLQDCLPLDTMLCKVMTLGGHQALLPLGNLTRGKQHKGAELFCL